MFNPLNLLSKIIKNSNQNELGRIQKIVEKINNLEKDVEILDNSEFLFLNCLFFRHLFEFDQVLFGYCF